MITILNDLHIGAVRSAGTTPQTAYKLRQGLLKGLENLLDKIHTDVLVNGDFFDGPNIPMADLLGAYVIVTQWLARGKHLWLSDGNHDLSKNSTVLSSFQFFAKLLVESYPEQVVHISGAGQHIGNRRYVIPHVANQDLFNLELTRMPANMDVLFLHANYDNKFAVEADHSLNMSEDQAKEISVDLIVFAHEHQNRQALKGKVQIVGNQLPSSVSDCLGNGEKYLAVLAEDNLLDMVQVLNVDTVFSQQDWRSLEDTTDFIRVTGTATAAEAAQMISVIAKFRADSSALVITNAVKVDGQNDTDEMALSHEDITTFNVMAELLSLLTPEEGVKVTNLLEKNHA